MDIDELKKQWQSMELRVAQLEQDNRRLLSRISSDRTMGLRQKLMNRYRAMVAVCVFSPVWISLMDNLYDISLWIDVCYTLFFLVMAVANGYVYMFIRRINHSTMSVKDALIAATNLEIMRRRLNILGYVLAIPLLAIMFYAFYEIGKPEIIYGAWTGLAIGCVCGLIYERKNRNLIKDLRQTLAAELSEIIE